MSDQYATHADLEALETKLLERIEKVETTLLTEFRKWALRIEAVLKPMPPRLSGLEDRVALIEARLDELDANERGGI